MTGGGYCHPAGARPKSPELLGGALARHGHDQTDEFERNDQI